MNTLNNTHTSHTHTQQNNSTSLSFWHMTFSPDDGPITRAASYLLAGLPLVGAQLRSSNHQIDGMITTDTIGLPNLGNRTITSVSNHI